jgi:hypothetical protein
LAIVEKTNNWKTEIAGRDHRAERMNRARRSLKGQNFRFACTKTLRNRIYNLMPQPCACIVFRHRSHVCIAAEPWYSKSNLRRLRRFPRINSPARLHLARLIN